MLLGLVKTSSALLEFSADPDTLLPPASFLWDESTDPPTPPPNPLTPLHVATLNNDPILISLLLSNFASPFIQSYAPPLPILTTYTSTRHSHIVNSFKKSKELPKLSPLSLACLENKNEAAKAFLQHPNFSFSTLIRLIPTLEMSPIVAAVVGNHGEENRNLLILSFFADYVPITKLSAMSNTPDRNNDVPLLVAANTSSPEVVSLLLDKLQASPNITKKEQSEKAERQAEELETLGVKLAELASVTEDSRAAIAHKGSPEELEQKMDVNRALKFSIDESWNAAATLLEEQDPEKKRRGGKTPSIKNLQEFATLKKPPSITLSKLALCLCHVLGGGNIGSTDPHTYDPKTAVNAPSYWNTFQRSARNLRIGTKMLKCKDTSIQASVITKVSALLPPPSSSFTPTGKDKYAPATRALDLWIRAVITSHNSSSSPAYAPAIIKYINNFRELDELKATIQSLETSIRNAPKQVNSLNICLRDPAPSFNDPGYGTSGPYETAERITRVASKLIDAGTSPHNPDITGETLLTAACRKQYWTVALQLLRHSTDVSGSFWGTSGMIRLVDQTPLDFACTNSLCDRTPSHRSARIDLIKTLLLRGAQPTIQAFHGAYISKDEVVLALLFVNGTPLPYFTSPANLLHSLSVNQKKTRRLNYAPDLPTYTMSYCANSTSLPRNSSPIPHFPRIQSSSMPHPKTLELCSYSSSDSTLHIMKNLLASALSATSLSVTSSLRINHALMSFPGGPPAIFTTFNQTTASLPSTISHPLSSLLVSIPSGNILLSDSSTTPFATIFNNEGLASTQSYKNFLRVLPSPRLPHTDTATVLTHDLAKRGDVELLNVLFSACTLMNRADADTAADMLTTENFEGKTAIQIALENGNVDAGAFLLTQMRNMGKRRKDKEGLDFGVVPSSQFRKLFVERGHKDLLEASGKVNAVAKLVNNMSLDGGASDPLISARASALLESLKFCGSCFGKIER